MRTEPVKRFSSGWLIVAPIVFAGFIYAFLPGWTIAFNDDFAYLRSIVETIQHGRPWTDDFLEPWALSLSGASAILFKLTGSFTVATVGLQICLPLISFFFAARLLFRATGSLPVALGLCSAILIFPTVLWKQAEFTAVILYLPALFAALWCAAREKWGWFWVAFAFAAASRQSAIAWLALPFAAATASLFARAERGVILRPAGAVVAGALWFAAISHYANPTHAQRFITAFALRSIEVSVFARNAGIAVGIAAVAAGITTLVLWLFGIRGDEDRVGTIGRVAGVAVAFALLATVPWVADSVPLSFEHPLFDNSWATVFLRALVVLGAIGWVVAPPRIAGSYFLTAVAALLLASVRSELWDYYLIDGVVFTIFGTVNCRSPRRTWAGASGQRGVRIAAGAVLLVGIVGAELAASGALKRSLDERAGFCAVLEKAMRAGWMKPTELSHAPFGFVAWHLFPYYLAHDGATSGDLAGFGVYVAEHAVDVHVDRVEWGHRLSPEDRTHPFAEVRPCGWFRAARFCVERRSDTKPPRLQIDGSTYRCPLFPLNDAEWREFILISADDLNREVR